ELARVLGCSVRTIQRWAADGLDAARVPGEATYSIPAAVAWRRERDRAELLESFTVDDFEIARTRRELARARLAEMEVATREGQLIPREVVERVYGDRLLDVLRSGVLNMPGRWG